MGRDETVPWPRAIAKERAEDAVIRIEGSLIVGAGMGDAAVFTRTLARLRKTLLTPEKQR